MTDNNLTTNTATPCNIIEDPDSMDFIDQENTYYCQTHKGYIGPTDEECNIARTIVAEYVRLAKETP